MKEFFTRPDGQEVSMDLEKIAQFAHNNQKIDIIKEFRFVSGLGLKDSKDAVEKFQRSNNYDIEGLLDAFRHHAGITSEPYTKEEFMHLVERTVDSMDDYHFTDMIQAVETMFNNVKNKGGLDALAKERDKFINKI